jgi:hypothetical protein
MFKLQGRNRLCHSNKLQSGWRTTLIVETDAACPVFPAPPQRGSSGIETDVAAVLHYDCRKTFSSALNEVRRRYFPRLELRP